MPLSLFDPFSFEAYFALGCVRFGEPRYDDAAAFLAKAVQANPRFSTLYAGQVAALAMAGRIDESKSIALRLLELEPGFRIQPLEATVGGFTRPEIVNGSIAGLREAGLPE